MEVGKSEYNQTGLAGFLRPAIARGELLCVAECTPEQLPVIERRGPAARRRLPPAQGGGAGRRAEGGSSSTATPTTAARTSAACRPAALDAIDRLHRRYATYSAFPGRPLRFLDNLPPRRRPQGAGHRRRRARRLHPRDRPAPRAARPERPARRAPTRDWFARRVIGQSEAVDLVVDLLATVKAGLTRPEPADRVAVVHRPDGRRQDGDGQGPGRVPVRLQGPADAVRHERVRRPARRRPRWPAAAFGGEGLLTAKVREQPFCVLLLDEFEKAHPSFLDLMLQVLGEARLTDAGGRLADFRNAVVILTSNLGAESYQAGHPGFRRSDRDGAEAKQHFVREVERFLRPEMFNRLDRLVPFAPLDAATIRHIARREWDKVLARDGVRFRGVTVTAADGVVPHLAEAGFDPKYGARPLKRAIERELLAPIAHQMNRLQRRAGPGRHGRPGRPASWRPRSSRGNTAAGRWRPSNLTGTEADAPAGASACVGCTSCSNDRAPSATWRTRCTSSNRSSGGWSSKQLKQKPVSAAEQTKLARLGRLREVAGEVRRQREKRTNWKTPHWSRSTPKRRPARRSPPGTPNWQPTGTPCCSSSTSRGKQGTDRLTLGVFSEDKDRLFAQAEAYAIIARSRGLASAAVQYLVATTAGRPAAVKPPEPPDDPGRGRPRVWQKDYLMELRKGEPLKSS